MKGRDENLDFHRSCQQLSGAHGWAIPGAVLALAPGDPDALKCKAVACIRHDEFELALQLIRDSPAIAGDLAFEQVPAVTDPRRTSAAIRIRHAVECGMEVPHQLRLSPLLRLPVGIGPNTHAVMTVPCCSLQAYCYYRLGQLERVRRSVLLCQFCARNGAEVFNHFFARHVWIVASLEP